MYKLYVMDDQEVTGVLSEKGKASNLEVWNRESILTLNNVIKWEIIVIKKISSNYFISWLKLKKFYISPCMDIRSTMKIIALRRKTNILANILLHSYLSQAIWLKTPFFGYSRCLLYYISINSLQASSSPCF